MNLVDSTAWYIQSSDDKDIVWWNPDNLDDWDNLLVVLGDNPKSNS